MIEIEIVMKQATCINLIAKTCNDSTVNVPAVGRVAQGTFRERPIHPDESSWKALVNANGGQMSLLAALDKLAKEITLTMFHDRQ